MNSRSAQVGPTRSRGGRLPGGTDLHRGRAESARAQLLAAGREACVNTINMVRATIQYEPSVIEPVSFVRADSWMELEIHSKSEAVAKALRHQLLQREGQALTGLNSLDSDGSRRTRRPTRSRINRTRTGTRTIRTVPFAAAAML